MDMARRLKRMERRKKQAKRPGINLISLMDIFTILVFFLLVSSSNVQQLPNKKDIRLPTSIASKPPLETLLIFVSKDKILVQGRQVAVISEEIDSPDILIPGLVEELQFQSAQSPILTESVGDSPNTRPAAERLGKPITVMGDELIPYKLIRKILASCREVDFTRVAFATMQKSSSGKGS